MGVVELFTLGLQHHRAGNFAYAEQLYRQVLQVNPTHVDAIAKLANVFFQQGNYATAIDAYRQALQFSPNDAASWYNLGLALQRLNRDAEALDCYHQALRIQPGLAVAWNNIGSAYRATGDIDNAIACYRHVLQLRPDYVAAHGNLGNALTDRGQLPEAVQSYRQALQLDPNQPELHSNLLYALHFCADVDAHAIYEEHRCWSRLHAEPLAPHIRPHDNNRSHMRRLRVGYVSPDFKWHPVGRFLLPFLAAHDRAAFEIYAYASQAVEDAVTAECRACSDVWRKVDNLSNDQLAQLIRQDKVDILVDLTMHMANNRMLAFALKPAPVQVTYLAYCGTTGLSAIDYRLTDPFLDPPGQDAGIYSEQSVRLPETYWCYRPVDNAPQVCPPPALGTGYVTFGCLNNFCKVTEATLQAWCKLLETMPNAQLLLHAHAGSHRERVRETLIQRQVSPDRLTFVDYMPTLEYLRLHEQIDIALDPFPYAGGTTTCDALWMGVPVVSLAGHTAVGRGGLSILSNIGLGELVARDVEQYRRIALNLAGDLPRLSHLRSTLRDRLRGSPLMDAQRFARNVEAAYREMWQRWCG
jgi:predicted O-linked N-acetylglucosamine transferase (SPINDLY family)